MIFNQRWARSALQIIRKIPGHNFIFVLSHTDTFTSTEHIIFIPNTINAPRPRVQLLTVNLISAVFYSHPASV